MARAEEKQQPSTFPSFLGVRPWVPEPIKGKVDGAAFPNGEKKKKKCSCFLLSQGGKVVEAPIRKEYS